MNPGAQQQSSDSAARNKDGPTVIEAVKIRMRTDSAKTENGSIPRPISRRISQVLITAKRVLTPPPLRTHLPSKPEGSSVPLNMKTARHSQEITSSSLSHGSINPRQELVGPPADTKRVHILNPVLDGPYFDSPKTTSAEFLREVCSVLL